MLLTPFLTGVETFSNLLDALIFGSARLTTQMQFQQFRIRVDRRKKTI